MPVILAIENDRQQVTQLKSIVRELGAELVLAASAERALAAIGQRVPDLILTPPLLSPKDDGALTARLRELGAAAIHVQMLSMPILATSGAQSRGRLSVLRRAKEESVGCAPEVFSEQLVEYLERAAVEKRAAGLFRPLPAAATVREQEAAEAHEEAKLVEGVQLVEKSLRAALQKEGLTEIETDGEFDPHVHEAMLAQQGNGAEPGSVLQVLQRGYRVGDRVVRPAKVIVAE